MAINPVNLVSNDFSMNSLRDTSVTKNTEKNAFDNILNSAMEMYSEANTLQKAAEEAEISFALGQTNSTHDLAVAQQKANIALQYTVKVTNAVVGAYKELMNMQI